MDIINHLSRTVSPAVLGDDNSPAKKNLLEQFYAIFAARLADDHTYSRFANDAIEPNDQRFYDRVWTEESHRDQIARELASKHGVDATESRALLALAAPLAYNEIRSLAGDTPVPQFLRNNHANYENHIPVWAAAVLPASALAGAAPYADTVSTAPLQRTEEDKGSFMKALLPIIGLIILGALAWALLRGCQDNPEPVGTPMVTDQQEAVAGDNAQNMTTATAAAIEPASLRLATGDANTLYACHMNVGDANLQATVMNAMTNVFGEETDKCRADVDDAYAADMPAADMLATILPIFKSVPNASMVIKGDEIVVNAPDPDVLQSLVTDLKAVAPSMTVMAEGPLDLQNEIDESVTAAETAMDNLGEQPNPRDVARALSLQVINFELDKAAIPEVNKPLLDRAVDMMAQVPDMTLMIIGHTDSLASDAYNMQLSQERAQAVKDYMVSQGADPSKLMTKGMGESDPIADNSTEQGRFRNRRIEFTVYDEQTATGNGITVTAGDNGDMGMTNRSLDAEGSAANTDSTIGTTNMPDPDLNPLDNNNDDVLPDGDDPTRGTALDPNANAQ